MHIRLGMKYKKTKKLMKYLTFCLLFTVIFSSGCRLQEKVGITAGFALPYDAGFADNEEGDIYTYDGSLYRFNSLNIDGADPGAVYYTDEELADSYDKLLNRAQQFGNFSTEIFEEQYGTKEEWISKYGNTFYMSVTGGVVTLSESEQKLYGAKWVSMPLYRSSDLNNWQRCGAVRGNAVLIEQDSFASANHHWAPEMKRDPDSGLFMFFHTLIAKQGSDETQYNKTLQNSTWDGFYIEISVSECPDGPYRLITTEQYYSYLAKYNSDGSLYTDTDGNAYYRDDIKKNTVLTKTEDSVFLNRNGDIVTIQTPPVNFGYFCDKVKATFPSTAHAGRGLFAVIDVNPFIDSRGELYLYFTLHASSTNSTNRIWVIHMFDWVSPDWDSLTFVLSPDGSSVYYDENSRLEGTIGGFNSSQGLCEGSFMIEKDGWFYMLYSTLGYTSRAYGALVAVADNPFGPFVKIGSLGNALQLDLVDDSDYMSGTGHCSVVKVGREYYIVYHAFHNGGEHTGRAIAADKLVFKTYSDITFSKIKEENRNYDLQIRKLTPSLIDTAFSTHNGHEYEVTVKDTDPLPVIYVNGPTYSLQPLPEKALPDGLRNVMLDGDVTVTVLSGNQKNAGFANDELISSQYFTEDYEVSGTDELKISVRFAAAKRIRNIMIYNSRNYDYAFYKVSSVVFRLASRPAWYGESNFHNGYCYIKDLPVDKYSFNSEKRSMRKCGSAMATFNEIAVDELIITLTAEDKICGTESAEIRLSEIYIAGK